MESNPNLNVTFFPPLYHQRRIWILDVLRRERFTEILDIGCGEGALLATLCQPAPWLKPTQFEGDDEELSSLFSNIGLNDQETPDLHTTRVAGLDISAAQLDIAAQCTSPKAVDPLYTRWEPLAVELWQGSVDVVNPAFVDMQCIIASELIEHLTDDVLAQIGPVVLGIYHPRAFLVTTPSYTFNARWAPPGSTDPGGYPDPTGRTDRVFRHEDHKFEWTVDEFVKWCQGIANRWGYAVETNTIGMANEEDPWGRDDVLGGATQVASFKRLDDLDSKAARERATQAASHTVEETHCLVATQRHEPHPSAGRPSDAKEIEESMVHKFRQWRETTLGVQELWFADNLSMLCGGSMELMLNVVEQSDALTLQQVAGQRQNNWKIELVGGLGPSPKETTPEESWTENMVYEDDEPECDITEGNSFDSGVHMTMSCDEAPLSPEEDKGWAQFHGGDWAGNWTDGWADTLQSD